MDDLVVARDVVGVRASGLVNCLTSMPSCRRYVKSMKGLLFAGESP